MNNYLKYAFRTIVLAASLVVLFVAGVFVYMKIHEAMITKVAEANIKLHSLNHWVSGEKLIFTAIAENQSEHEWLNFSLNFIIKNEDGSFFRKCPLVLLNKPFSLGDIDIEAVCNNMPVGFKIYTFEVRVAGEY